MTEIPCKGPLNKMPWGMMSLAEFRKEADEINEDCYIVCHGKTCDKEGLCRRSLHQLKKKDKERWGQYESYVGLGFWTRDQLGFVTSFRSSNNHFHRIVFPKNAKIQYYNSDYYCPEYYCDKFITRGQVKYLDDVTEDEVETFGGPIQFVEIQTPELCRKAVNSRGEAHGTAIQFIREQTAELCELAVKNDPDALSSVHEQFKTAKLCRLAVEVDGHTIESVPEQLITEELCLIAIQAPDSRFALQVIPKRYHTKKVLLAAVTKFGRAMEYIDKSRQTPDICEAAIRQDPYAIYYMHKDNRTPELCELTLSLDPNMERFI